jgi:acyl-coenzyme A thioesterase PaaI-like protein
MTATAWSADDETRRRELVDAVRALASAAMLTTADDETMGAVRDLLRQATARLAAATRSGRYDARPGLSAGIGGNDAIWETHAAFGRSNPLAPPLVDVREERGHLEATVTFGPAFEGGPGTVYGGFVAAAFDGLLGRTVISSGHLAVTRSLAVRFLRPTPLNTTLRVEATAGDLSGRDISVSGQLWHGTKVTCEADAVFTTVAPAPYVVTD